MASLVDHAEKKVDQCEESSNCLQHSLTDLENQRDDAKATIEEAFQVTLSLCYTSVSLYFHMNLIN